MSSNYQTLSNSFIASTKELSVGQRKSVPYSSTRGLFSPQRFPSIEIGLSFSNLLWIKTGSYSFTQGKISTLSCTKKTETNVDFSHVETFSHITSHTSSRHIEMKMVAMITCHVN